MSVAKSDPYSKTNTSRAIDTLKRQLFSLGKPAKLDVNKFRKDTERMASANPMGKDVHAFEDIIANIPVLRIAHRNANKSRKVLYLHGGGFISGSAQAVAGLAGELSRHTQAEIIALDYSLAPENKYPKSLDEATDVYRSLATNKDCQLALSGDSAGGGLAVSLACRIRDLKLERPRSVLLLCPWLDLSHPETVQPISCEYDPVLSWKILAEMANHYKGTCSLSNPELSPLLGNLESLPPIYIQAAERDILLRDATLFQSYTKETDTSVTLKVWPEMIHVWQALTSILPEANDALFESGQWMNTHWKTESLL